MQRTLPWIGVLALSVASVSGQTVNPANGHGYLLTGTATNITTARTLAAAAGGYLVAINDAQESAFLIATFGAGRRWIGLSDEFIEGTFLWDSGEPLTFTSWCSGEPNNSGGLEHYVEVLGSGCWNDQPASGNGLISQGIIEIPNFALADFQVNQPDSQLDLNGVIGSAYSPSRWQGCVGTPSTLNLGSAVGAGFEIVITLGPLVGLSGAGFALPDGQIVNVGLFGPLFLNGGTLPAFAPSPGPLTVPVVPQVPLTISAQQIVLNPALPLGLALSGGVELTALAGSSPTTVPGPTGDDTSVRVDVTNAPLCWCPSGISFFGITHNVISIASNGRVTFGPDDNDFSATVAEALGDAPFVGFWNDLNPSLGGAITASSAVSGVVRVDYTNVPYFGQPATSVSFAVEFDCSTGTVGLIGLSGIVSNPGNGAQFLGMSPGNLGPATDPGVAPFAPAAFGGVSQPTQMLYDFGTGLVPSLGSGLAAIQFTPDGAGNYIWVGF